MGQRWWENEELYDCMYFWTWTIRDQRTTKQNINYKIIYNIYTDEYNRIGYTYIYRHSTVVGMNEWMNEKKTNN